MDRRETTLPPIPDPQLQLVENNTPFPHLAFDKMGKARLFYDVVVVKGTYALAAGELKPAAQQTPIALADRYWDEEHAEHSSIRIAGDVLLVKPYTDILIVGSARTHDGKARKSWDAGVRVSVDGEFQCEHRMRLLGPRNWAHTPILGWQLGEPVPADSIALRHENAYGGHPLIPTQDDSASGAMIFDANPAGCGHWVLKQMDKSLRYPGPQIETIDAPVKRIGAGYPLACPAPLARFWKDRKRYGGTYDAAWQHQLVTSRIADYPHDFDIRFFQCAHPALICKTLLSAGAKIALVGLTKGDSNGIGFELPRFEMVANVTAVDASTDRMNFVLDTVLIDLDKLTVSLTWRLTLDQRLGIEKLDITCSYLAWRVMHGYAA